MKLYHRVTVDEPNTVEPVAVFTRWDSPHYHGFILTLPFPVYREVHGREAALMDPYRMGRVVAGWWLYQIVRVTEGYDDGCQHISKGYWFPWKVRSYGRWRPGRGVS